MIGFYCLNCVILSKIYYVHKLINFKLNFAMIAILGMSFSLFVMFDEFCQVDLKAWTKRKKSVSTSSKSFLLFSSPFFLVYDFDPTGTFQHVFQVFAVWASVGSTSVLIKGSPFCIWTHYEFWNSAKLWCIISSNVSALNGAFLQVITWLNIHPGFIIENQTEKSTTKIQNAQNTAWH